jgi:hypothetical protein
VFRVPSLGEAARLAEAIAQASGIAGAGVLLTLADTRVSVRLSRDIWNLEQSHIQFAQAVPAVARKLGAVPDRTAVQEVQVAIAAKRDEMDVGFWRAVLGYIPMADDNAVDPLGHGSTVWMQELNQAKPVAPCYAHRRVCRAREGQGADRCGRRCRRSYRRRVTCASALDARRPRGQPRLYLRVAGWREEEQMNLALLTRRALESALRSIESAEGPLIPFTFVLGESCLQWRTGGMLRRATVE